MFGECGGFAHFAIGHGPRRTPSGTYRFDRFEPISFLWPDQADEALARLDEAVAKPDCDLFFCPNLLGTGQRAKNTAVTHRLLHADADNGVAAEKLASLNAFTVASGRPGHLHVYVQLDREVSRDQYKHLQRGMRQYFNGDNKIADNDLLRPVGSMNHKAVAYDGLDRPYEVKWDLKPSGRLVDPELAAEILGLAAGSEYCSGSGFDSANPCATEAVDLSAFPLVAQALDKQTADRSSDTHRIVTVCYQSGLTLAQSRRVIDQRPDLSARLAERVDDDVLRIFLKNVDGEQREKSGDGGGENLGKEIDFADAVQRALRRMRINEEARSRYSAEKRIGNAEADIASPREILERSSEPLYRIDGLLPAGGAMVVAAQRKTGKTTFVLNLAHSLITGERFLGVHAVEPINGYVALMNYEVSARQMAVWASQVGICSERLILINLRGVRNPLLDEEGSDELANKLAGFDIATLIVDPFAQAYGGSSQNDAAEVSRFLARLDHFARAKLGVDEVILTAHAGWKAERSRGSSALEDWPDSIVTMTRGDAPDGPRYLKAEGRDVHVAEDQLLYDPRTRQLTMSGRGARRDVSQAQKVDHLIPHVITAVDKHGAEGTQAVINDLRDQRLGVSFQDADARAAIKGAEKRGLLRSEPGGQGKKTKLYVVDQGTSTARD